MGFNKRDALRLSIWCGEGQKKSRLECWVLSQSHCFWHSWATHPGWKGAICISSNLETDSLQYWCTFFPKSCLVPTNSQRPCSLLSVFLQFSSIHVTLLLSGSLISNVQLAVFLSCLFTLFARTLSAWMTSYLHVCPSAFRIPKPGLP